MDNLTSLERQIRQRLDAVATRRRTSQETVRREMEEYEQRKTHFEAVGERLLHSAIHPRVVKLASLFPNAHVSEKDPSVGYGSVCRFDHTPEYPASTTLDVGVSADGAITSAIITYHLEILPIYFQFEGHDQLVVSLDANDESAIASWLDAKLLSFTDTYLRLQVVDQYQQANMVVDPVCGMRINRADAAAVAEFEGQKYYFCVAECRHKFLDEPERYAARRHK